MKVYKLTTQDGKTRPGEFNEIQWGEGVEHVAPGGVPGECGDGWLHAYYSPLAATLLNSVHARIDEPICWECDADVAEDHSDKLLCTRIKTIRRVDLPEIPPEQRVEIAIRATMVVYDEPSWVQWSQDWLSETDRSAKSAWSTVKAARAQTAAERASWAWASWWASPKRASRATWVAARAASSAARAAARVAEVAARAASATLAADAVALAAASAELTVKTLNLNEIINDVLAGGKSFLLEVCHEGLQADNPRRKDPPRRG